MEDFLSPVEEWMLAVNTEPCGDCALGIWVLMLLPLLTHKHASYKIMYQAVGAFVCL